MKATVVFLTLLMVTASAGFASADTTYQVDPKSKVDKPDAKTTKPCDDATKASLANVVQVTSQIKLAKDGVYYKTLGGDGTFHKATTSVDNYGFIKSPDATIVLAVFPAKIMDSPRASDARNEVMIGVIKRGKQECSERWFGFAKAVTP